MPSPADAPQLSPKAARIAQGPLFGGVLRFGLPLVVGMVLYGTFNLVDLFMLSRIEGSADVLAALGICDMLFALGVIVATGVSNSSVAVLSRRLGEGDREGVQHAAWQSLLLMAVASLVVGLGGGFAAPWIIESLMQAKGEVARLATSYLRIMMAGSYSIFLLLQVTAILRSLGHATWAAVLLVAGNALNVVLAAVAIYGPGPSPAVFAWAQPIAIALGVDRMGMDGAAWATLIGRSLPLAAGLGVLLLARDGLQLRRRYFILDLRLQWRLLSLGWPSSAQLALRVGTVLVFLALVARHYTSADDATVLTAYSICLRLEVLVLFVSMGWGAAAATYMGVNLGAAQAPRALRASWLAAAFNAVSCGLLVLGFVLFAAPIIAFFDPEPAVLAAGEHYLRIVAASYIALGVGVVLSQGLTGAGATLASFLLDAAVLGLLVLPTAFLLAGPLEQPPSTLWYTLLASNLLAAAVFAVYFARGRFVERKV